jgi:hypothetical protein
MRICPKCNTHQRGLQKRVQDKKTKKNWLITYYGHCKFNFDIEESKGGTTAKEEPDKPWTPPPFNWEKQHDAHYPPDGADPAQFYR